MPKRTDKMDKGGPAGWTTRSSVDDPTPSHAQGVWDVTRQHVFLFLCLPSSRCPFPPTLLVPVLNAGGPRIHGQSSLLRDMGLSICPHGCRFVPVVMCCRANHCASPRLRGSERLEPRKAVRTWSAVTADSHGSRCDKLADWSGARPPDCEDRLRVPGYRSSDIGTTRHGWDG